MSNKSNARVIAHSHLAHPETDIVRRIAVLDRFDGDLVRVRLDTDETYETGVETWAHLSEIGKPKSVIENLDVYLESLPVAQLERIEPTKHHAFFGTKSKGLESARSSALEKAQQRSAEEQSKREAAQVLREEARQREAQEAQDAIEARLREVVREEMAASASPGPAAHVERPAAAPTRSAPQGSDLAPGPSGIAPAFEQFLATVHRRRREGENIEDAVVLEAIASALETGSLTPTAAEHLRQAWSPPPPTRARPPRRSRR